MPDGDALSDWVRKSLQAGDSPDIVKAALKNRGYDPHIVDIVHKFLVSRRKEAERIKATETKPMHSVPKREPAEPVEPVPVAPEQVKPVIARNDTKTERETETETRTQKSGAAPVFENNPQKERFKLPVPALPGFDIKAPKIHFGDIDLGATRIIIVGIVFLLILVAIVFGISWYADMMAKRVLP